MTIKQHGGVFGRNPTFNDVTVEGTLTVNGEPISDFGTMAQQDANNVNIDGGAVDGITLGTNAPVTVARIDNIKIDGNTISSENTNGNIVLNPDGTGLVQVSNATKPQIELFNGKEWGSGDDGTMSSITTFTADGSGGGPRAVAEIEVYNNVGSSVPAGEFRFKTSQGGGAATFLECFRLDNNGDAIFFTNDGVSTITAGAKFDATSGNLVFPSGKGIDFSATAGTGTSELFDDYEEGTWTPTQGNFATWTSPTFNATYIKIGRIVTVSLTQTGGTISGNALQYIGGLPFAPKAGLRGTSTSSNANVLNVADLLAWDDANIYVISTTGSQASWCFSITYEVA